MLICNEVESVEAHPTSHQIAYQGGKMAKAKFRTIPELSAHQSKSFHGNIDKRGIDECWPWTGRIMKKQSCQYGTFCITKPFGEIPAHRLSFKLHSGIDPAHLWVLHRCDNPICVNPSHLFLGTFQDNVDDMVRKGRHMHGDGHYLRQHPRCGQAHNRASLTDAEALEIKSIYPAGGHTQKALGQRYGVSEACIQKIVSGKNYSHLKV